MKRPDASSYDTSAAIGTLAILTVLFAMREAQAIVAPTLVHYWTGRT